MPAYHTAAATWSVTMAIHLLLFIAIKEIYTKYICCLECMSCITQIIGVSMLETSKLVGLWDTWRHMAEHWYDKPCHRKHMSQRQCVLGRIWGDLGVRLWSTSIYTLPSGLPDWTETQDLVQAAMGPAWLHFHQTTGAVCKLHILPIQDSSVHRINLNHPVKYCITMTSLLNLL